MIETRENAAWEPVWTKMTKIPGTADYDGWEMDEVVVIGKMKPKTKDRKVNSTLEYLKDGKEVKPEDLEMMKEVLSDKEALKLLEKKLEEKESKILLSLSEDQMKKVYQNLPPQERQNFEKLFNKISVDREQKAKKAELQRVIKDKKVELAKLEGGIRSGSTYKVENFRSKNESKEEVKRSSTENVSSAISDQEMENLNKILWGKFLVEEKLNKVEKKLKSDFKKAIVMLKENSNASMMEVIQAFNKGNMSKAEVEKSFARKDKKEWKEKEIDKLQKGYLAYLETKKGNPDTSRWNAVIGTLETGLLNLGQSLDTILVENVSMPISKKERKVGEKEFKKEFFAADTGEFKDLKNNYLKEHAQEIQELKQYSGYSNEEIKEYINKKAYKQYLKEQEKFWIQKSDLGKFRVLINALEGKSVEDKITALLTDTNFDGMRNRLDGRGTKRGNQIDQALIVAQRSGKTIDNISENIVNYLNSKGENIELKAPSADSFAKWLSADIKNAIKVQSALMDSPVDAVDIMSYGSGALTKSLKKTTFYTEKEENQVLQKLAGLPEDIKAKLTTERAKWSFSDWQKFNEAFDKSELTWDQRKQLGQLISKIREGVNFSKEELKAIEDKIATDPATKNLSAAARETLMANLSGYLLSKMKESGANAKVNGLGIGVNVPLNQILKGLSFSLGTGATMEGKSFAGVSVAWNKEVVKWKDGGASVGLNAGTTLGLIPIYGFRVGIEQDVNAKKVLGSVDPISLKTFSAGVNLTMIGKIPSYGASIGFEKNQIKGIEKQYAHIKKEITPLIKKLLTKEGDKYPDIAQTLQSLFKNSSKEEIQKATENLTSILKMVQDQGLDAEKASQFIGERYAESWRDNAIQGLPKGWKFTGASLGIQFLAGFFPIGTLGMTLTKYKNFSYEDSPESWARYQQRIERGVWDEEEKNVEPTDFAFIQKQLEASNVLRGEKIVMDKEGKVHLPKSLINKEGFTVRINKDMQKYLKMNEQKTAFILPKGLSYRFLTNAGTNKSSALLDIGYKKGGKFITLTTEMVPEQSEDYQLAQKISAFNAKLQTLEGLKDYSLDKNGVLFKKTGEKSEQVLDVNGKSVKIDATSGLKFDGEKVEVVQTGGLQMINALPLNSEDIVTLNREVSTTLKGLENQLKQLRKKKSQAYRKVAGASRAENTTETNEEVVKNSKADAIVDAKDKKGYLLAAKELLNEIKRSEQTESLYKALKITRKDKNEHFENQNLAHQVIDQIKVIMAEIDSKLKDSNQEIQKLTQVRDSQFKFKSALQAFTGVEGVDYAQLAGKLNSTKSETKSNIIGFTAFYRKGVERTERGMGLTPYGHTNVLGQTFDLPDSSKESAKNWIIDNLKNHPAQMQTISRSLGKVANGPTKGVNKDWFLTNDSLITLLKNWSVDVDNWKKISITSINPVAYFLAECANQSIGLELWNLKIEKAEQITFSEGKMTYNTGESLARASVKEKDVNVGIAFGGKAKEQRAKTQWGENPSTQWGDNGDSQWGVNNWTDVGDHVDGHIPSGGDVSPDNPWKVDGIPWDNPISNENPLDL